MAYNSSKEEFFYNDEKTIDPLGGESIGGGGSSSGGTGTGTSLSPTPECRCPLWVEL